MSEILKYAQAMLAERQKRLEAELVELKKQCQRLNELSNEGEIVYKIDLLSGWANEGEKHTNSRVKGSLRRAMKVATDKFKKVNRRPDVQGQCFVTAIFSDSPLVAIPLPRTMWGDFFEEFGTDKSSFKP